MPVHKIFRNVGMVVITTPWDVRDNGRTRNYLRDESINFAKSHEFENLEIIQLDLKDFEPVSSDRAQGFIQNVTNGKYNCVIITTILKADKYPASLRQIQEVCKSLGISFRRERVRGLSSRKATYFTLPANSD